MQKSRAVSNGNSSSYVHVHSLFGAITKRIAALQFNVDIHMWIQGLIGSNMAQLTATAADCPIVLAEDGV